MMTPLNFSRYLLVLTALFPLAAGANSAFERKAGALADRIDFLSQIEARDYVPMYEALFSQCMESTVWADECMKKADDQVRQKAIAEKPQSFLIHRFSKLYKDGHLSRFLAPNPNAPFLGIIGDSLATGALADLKLAPNALFLPMAASYFALFQYPANTHDSGPRRDMFSATDLFVPEEKEGHLAPLLRVYDSATSKKAGLDRGGENSGSTFIDCEECSFGYFLARAASIPPSNIFMAAQDGKRVNSVFQQIERLNFLLNGLPDTVLISYTGNDICSPDNANVSALTKRMSYAVEMVKQLESAVNKFKPYRGHTKFIIVAAADLRNILNNQSVLDKKVSYYPADKNPAVIGATCRQIRNQSIPLAKNLNNMCKYVLNTSPDDVQRMQHVDELYQGVVAAQKDTAESMSRYVKTKKLSSQFSFYFLDDIQNVNYDGADISNECFHPSIYGHQKIARELLPSFLDALASPVNQ